MDLLRWTALAALPGLGLMITTVAIIIVTFRVAKADRENDSDEREKDRAHDRDERQTERVR
jgi:hypothetical protein